MKENSEEVENLIGDLERLEVNSELDENKNVSSTAVGNSKVGYYDRKLDHKLKKYEAYLKKHENINRIDEESQVGTQRKRKYLIFSRFY